MELVLVIISVTVLKDGLVTYAIKVIYNKYISLLYSIIHIIAVCIPQCGHGTCIQPDECTCDPGWTGLRCKIG